MSDIIPAGSLAFSGYGDAPMQFTDPNGVVYPSPTPDPQLGAGGCSGIATNADGVFYATGLLVGSQVTQVYSSQLALIGTPVSGNTTNDIATDAAGHGYTLKMDAGDPTVTLEQVDAAGVVTQTWDVTGDGTGRECLAVNAGATLALVADADYRKVYAWDLTGDTDLGAIISLSPLSNYTTVKTCIMFLASGEFLVGWNIRDYVIPIVDLGEVKRYDASYAEVATYALPYPPNTITRALDDDHFWVSYTDYNGAPDSTTVSLIRVADGVIESTFTKPLGGFEWDAPFCVVRKDIGRHLLSVPVLSYTPYQTVLRSPTLKKTR